MRSQKSEEQSKPEPATFRSRGRRFLQDISSFADAYHRKPGGLKSGGASPSSYRCINGIHLCTRPCFCRWQKQVSIVVFTLRRKLETFFGLTRREKIRGFFGFLFRVCGGRSKPLLPYRETGHFRGAAWPVLTPATEGCFFDCGGSKPLLLQVHKWDPFMHPGCTPRRRMSWRRFGFAENRG